MKARWHLEKHINIKITVKNILERVIRLLLLGLKQKYMVLFLTISKKRKCTVGQKYLQQLMQIEASHFTFSSEKCRTQKYMNSSMNFFSQQSNNVCLLKKAFFFFSITGVQLILTNAKTIVHYGRLHLSLRYIQQINSFVPVSTF